MCDSGKGESFYEGSKKKGSARKISRCAPHDGMDGMGKTYFMNLKFQINNGI